MAAQNPLGKYHAKRDFGVTAEPRGTISASGAQDVLQFVVQRHQARSLHYDFRLELDGVLKSWAVPKGPSDDPQIKRLAVQTEDHPLDYAQFAGTIPPGHYGAGRVEIWDSGTWAPAGDAHKDLARGHLKFRLAGKRLSGDWVLLRIASGDQWLLKKVEGGVSERIDRPSIAKPAARSDGAASRAPRRASSPPSQLGPMLATLVERAPEALAWTYEIKYDGYRMLCRIGDGAVRFLSRNGREWTDRLAGLAARIAQSPLACSGAAGWLDGEVVVFNDNGMSDFQALQAALGGASSTLVFVVFDVLQWDGADLRDLPFAKRVGRLDALLRGVVSTSGLQRSERFESPVGPIWDEACRLGFEGLIGKRRDSPYVAGRSRDWIKLKCRPRQEVVIGGYSDPAGARSGFGALLVGVREGKRLRYVGRVGTGFTQASLAKLKKRLEALATTRSPFDGGPPRGAGRVHWVAPELVAEATYAGWTESGQLRQAAFEGLRDDKPADEVARERPAVHLSAPRVSQGSRARADRADKDTVAGVVITHPERLVFRTRATTKLQLAQYYERVGDAFFAELKDRPMSLLRCPDGADGKCFFQKHLQDALPGIARLVQVGSDSADARLVADTMQGVIGLVQRGVVEFHTWGSRRPKINRPDRITLDLDPDGDVPWPRVAEAAQLVRALLDELELPGLLKTTGGKGLHVVVAIRPTLDWSAVKAFARRIATHLANVFPDRFTATLAKSARKNKIFIDYLRNAEEATAVAAWSVRARLGAPVSMPLAWDELSARRDVRGDHFNVENAAQRLDSEASRAWDAMDQGAVTLSKKTLGFGD